MRNFLRKVVLGITVITVGVAIASGPPMLPHTPVFSVEPIYTSAACPMPTQAILTLSDAITASHALRAA